MRVLELYSGIGGLHYALSESGIAFEVVAAADVNTVANQVYQHNFPQTKIVSRGIESLTVKDLDKLSPDLIHMSPPCQPFARVGRQRDAKDVRTQSFLHLISLLPRVQKMPDYIFLENVKGFEVSDTHRRLLEMLKQSCYAIQEFMLSPLQCGIPNSRLRYYLLAKREPLKFDFPTQDKIQEEFPGPVEGTLLWGRSHDTPEEQREECQKESSPNGLASPTTPDPATADRTGGLPRKHNQVRESSVNSSSSPASSDSWSESKYPLETARRADCVTSDRSTDPSCPQSVCKDAPGGNSLMAESLDITSDSTAPTDCQCLTSETARPVPSYEKYRSICLPLSQFLEIDTKEDCFQDFRIPDKLISRFWVMDIVSSDMKHSCCFTKGYGHHIEGAGSIIQMNLNSAADLAQYKRDRVFSEEVERGVRSMGLRFFTPREIANLMCFPTDFEFPPELSKIQCYRLLGNSLNVHVVSILLRLLVGRDCRKQHQNEAAV